MFFVLDCRGSNPSSVFEECFLLKNYFFFFFFFLGLKLSFMAATPVRIAPIPRRISPKIRIDSSLHIRNTYICKKAPNCSFVVFSLRTCGGIHFYYVLRIVLKNYQEFFSWCTCHNPCSVFNHQFQFGQSFPLRPVFFLVNNEFGYPPIIIFCDGSFYCFHLFALSY